MIQGIRGLSYRTGQFVGGAIAKVASPILKGRPGILAFILNKNAQSAERNGNTTKAKGLKNYAEEFQRLAKSRNDAKKNGNIKSWKNQLKNVLERYAIFMKKQKSN